MTTEIDRRPAELSPVPYDEPLSPADIALSLIPLVGPCWVLYTAQFKGELSSPRFRRRVALNTLTSIAALSLGGSAFGVAAVAIGAVMVLLIPSERRHAELCTRDEQQALTPGDGDE